MKLGTIYFISLFFSLDLFAAISPGSVSSKNILNQVGAVHGGVAGIGFSLLNIKKIPFSHQKAERWIVDVGNIKGQKNKGLPGYYHLQLQKNPAQIAIDFSQMPTSFIGDKELTQIVKNSVAIKSGKLISDPTDKTLTLILELKKPLQVKVMQVNGVRETSKLVLDLIL